MRKMVEEINALKYDNWWDIGFGLMSKFLDKCLEKSIDKSNFNDENVKLFKTNSIRIIKD